MSDGKGRRYGSFLLRLWRTDSHGHAIWRVLIEDPMSGERHGFATAEELAVFLRTWMAGDQPDSSPGPDPTIAAEPSGS